MEIVVLEHSYRKNWALSAIQFVCVCTNQIKLYFFDVLNLFFSFFLRNGFAFIKFVVPFSLEVLKLKRMIK